MSTNTLNTAAKKHRQMQAFASALCCFLLVFTFVTTPSTITYCTAAGNTSDIGNALISMVTNMSSEIYRTMRGIIIPIVICFLAYAGVTFLTGGSRGAESAIKIVKYCFVAVIFVAFAPVIGKQIGEWVAGSGTGDLGSYNPLA